jgi:hypothetical protein
VFADAAARTTALTGVVSEGMISYLKDTNAVEVYDGSNWVSSDDPNAIQNTIVDAKGDLITATAADTPARLAVGSNGDTLVADSAATTGLRWQPDFSVGRNKIINGDFSINQRQFSSTTTNATYIFDRWFTRTGGDGTGTFTPQTFTPGAAPVSGYEATNYVRIVTAGSTSTNTLMALRQRIEDVRTFAGQTITISFWAKAASGTPKMAIPFTQSFGSGGSSDVVTPATGAITISTSWARYSTTISVPSISGKTVGAGSYAMISLAVSVGSDFATDHASIGIQNNTFEIWGVQAENGSVATAFQTATGTLQGELAACQRYYYQRSSLPGAAYSTTAGRFFSVHPVTMRVNPTITYPASLTNAIEQVGVGNATPTALSTAEAGVNYLHFNATGASGLTLGTPLRYQGNEILFSSEL